MFWVLTGFRKGVVIGCMFTFIVFCFISFSTEPRKLYTPNFIYYWQYEEPLNFVRQVSWVSSSSFVATKLTTIYAHETKNKRIEDSNNQQFLFTHLSVPLQGVVAWRDEGSPEKPPFDKAATRMSNMLHLNNFFLFRPALSVFSTRSSSLVSISCVLSAPVHRVPSVGHWIYRWLAMSWWCRWRSHGTRIQHP